MLIRGTVTDDDDHPVAWAAVWFASGDHPTPDVAVMTGDDGGFTLTPPAAGTYRLGCRADSYDPVEVTVEVADADVEVAITLPAGTAPA